MTKKEIKKNLKEHKRWLAGLGGTRADLHDVDLRGVNLRDVDLRYANLHNIILSGVDLRYARLNGADLSNAVLVRVSLEDAALNFANLNGANLIYASLRRADLQGASLCGSNLSRAVLDYADLRGTKLNNAVLREAKLSNVDLEGAELNNTDLHNTILNSVNLSNAVEFRNGKILTEPLIGYKKCRDDVIVTLEIPKGAIVFSTTGGNCRTNKVKVLAVDGANEGVSWFNGMPYCVGDEITIDDFVCRYNVECGPGIHFFVDREIAEKYQYLPSFRVTD